MTQEKAIQKTQHLVSKHKVVAVTGDGQVYLDCNPETLLQHCKDQQIKLYPVKGFPDEGKKKTKKETE